MKHQTLRISFSVLLMCASFVFSLQLFTHKYGTDKQFLLVVQVLLFVFLSSANYTDRKKVLVGRRKTHLAIIILLSIVLSINGFLLMNNPKANSASVLQQNNSSTNFN